MQKDNSLERDLMVGITSGSRRRGHQRTRWLDCTLVDSGISFAKLLHCAEIVTHGDTSFIESLEVGDNLTAYRKGVFGTNLLKDYPVKIQ